MSPLSRLQTEASVPRKTEAGAFSAARGRWRRPLSARKGARRSSLTWPPPSAGTREDSGRASRVRVCVLSPARTARPDGPVVVPQMNALEELLVALLVFLYIPQDDELLYYENGGTVPSSKGRPHLPSRRTCARAPHAF